MRFFRGMAVPASRVDEVLSTITKDGLDLGRSWHMEYRHPGPLHELFAKTDLSVRDTRPKDQEGCPAVCACGEELGAACYAWEHNCTGDDDTPIMVEFEAEQDAVAVDGRDFLCTVFQFGEPASSRAILEKTFGHAILRYAEKAWASPDQDTRVAMCDLARHDPGVVEAHHTNSLVIAGRYRTVFRSAFIVKLPVEGQRVCRVWSPSERPAFPMADISLGDLLRRN